MAEDCLYLNIFAPANATNASGLPVMVFGHGGGDRYGSSSMGVPTLANGTNMLEASGAQVVLVVINYRVNVFGYLAHPAFAAEDPKR